MTRKELTKTTRSRFALYSFYKTIGSYTKKANVQAYVDGVLKYDSMDVDIVLSSATGEDSGIGKISIMWEKDDSLDFRALGLYGYYDINYDVDIEYEEDALFISSGDVEILIT